MRSHWLALAVLLAACGGETAVPTPPPDPTAYAASIESWRADRLEGLRRPDSWLSLAGLYWLEEGANSIGADPASDLVFPDGRAEPRLGVLRRADRQVRFESAAGAVVTREGEPVTSLELVSDAGGKPTTLEHGSLFVSRGLGGVEIPMRSFAPPDVALLSLRAKKEKLHKVRSIQSHIIMGI